MRLPHERRRFIRYHLQMEEKLCNTRGMPVFWSEEIGGSEEAFIFNCLLYSDPGNLDPGAVGGNKLYLFFSSDPRPLFLGRRKWSEDGKLLLINKITNSSDPSDHSSVATRRTNGKGIISGQQEKEFSFPAAPRLVEAVRSIGGLLGAIAGCLGGMHVLGRPR